MEPETRWYGEPINRRIPINVIDAILAMDRAYFEAKDETFTQCDRCGGDKINGTCPDCGDRDL